MAVAVFAEALEKVTWISEQHLCIVGVVEAMVKGLVLEALGLEIARIANHWLVVVAAAEIQLPIWAVSISESGNRNLSKKYI